MNYFILFFLAKLISGSNVTLLYIHLSGKYIKKNKTIIEIFRNIKEKTLMRKNIVEQMLADISL